MLFIIAIIAVFAAALGLSILFNYSIIEYLWQKDMEVAIADLDHDSPVWDIQQTKKQKTCNYYKWEKIEEVIPHTHTIRFIDGEEKEVYVPKRDMWYRTILLDRRAKEIKRLRTKKKELEGIILDLDEDHDHLEERIHRAAEKIKV